jgi:hypothetical protein
MLATPSTAWAESAIPDPAAFFEGLINPKAKGKEVAGFLTIAYEFGEAPDPDACPSIFINDMHVVTTLERKDSTKPFNSNFSKTGTSPFCFDDFPSQIDLVMGLLTEEVIPFFFGPCQPEVDCPSFEVKAIKEFLSSGTGAISMELKLAVDVPRPRPHKWWRQWWLHHHHHHPR